MEEKLHAHGKWTNVVPEIITKAAKMRIVIEDLLQPGLVLHLESGHLPLQWKQHGMDKQPELLFFMEY